MSVLFRRWVPFAWVSLLTAVGLSCGQSTQSQLNRSAAEVRSCADDQKLSPNEEATIRQTIRADDKRQRIEAIMQQKVREGLNGNVLIAQKGVVLYKHCFGLAHFEKNNRDSLTNRSKFQLASLSKTFTAVAVLKLQEMGKLNFTDSIQQFFPD